MSLENLRKKIDELDASILRLLNRRARYACEIADLKRDRDDDAPIYRPEREAQLLRRLLANNEGPLPDHDVVGVFREITSVCRALEAPLSVGYLGPPGTFTEEAALKHFGSAMRAKGLKNIDDVFRAVEVGEMAYGVVPIENSIEGAVTHTLDQFIVSPLKVVGEIHLQVHQHLLSRAGKIGDIKKVLSHRQSLAQCRHWLAENLPSVVTEEVSSNAEAVRCANEDDTVAAIAGIGAAHHYNVPVLARNLENRPDNTTRFLIIGAHEVPASGKDKTSLLVSIHDRAGALLELLEPLAKHNVSMTHIESRPAGNVKWEYVFFLDVIGHHSDEALSRALIELKQRSSLLKLLGSYPEALS